MKLKKFDFKLPNEKKRKNKIMITSISAVALILIITLASTFAYYQSIENQNQINTSVGEFSSGDVILAVTIDGVASNDFPAKDAGYIAESVICDKGASGNWNNEEWVIVVSNLVQSKTACNISFVTLPTLKEAILAQFGGETSITFAPSNTFMTVSSATAKLMYKSGDNYGTSYYYRGAGSLLDNNLIFAGYIWKIVRINGDSSIRLIYNGTCPNNSCTINSGNSGGSNALIKVARFNTTDSNYKFVGYMYGTVSSPWSSAILNQNNSNVKVELENWYTTNIESQGVNVTNKISDTLFCNDRQQSGVEPFYYAAYDRLNPYSEADYYNVSPTFFCGAKGDRFTVSDVSIGNAALSKPVGLISADEVAFAGAAWNIASSTHYLYTGQSIWTSSPHGGANLWILAATMLTSTYPSNNLGVRAVINLVPGIQATGDGTISNPFKVI